MDVQTLEHENIDKGTTHWCTSFQSDRIYLILNSRLLRGEFIGRKVVEWQLNIK